MQTEHDWPEPLIMGILCQGVNNIYNIRNIHDGQYFEAAYIFIINQADIPAELACCPMARESDWPPFYLVSK